MITIGFRDFTVRQITEILEGARICLEKKLENDMKPVGAQAGADAVFKVGEHFDQHPQVDRLYKRAVHIALLSHSIQAKDCFSYQTLSRMAESLNSLVNESETFNYDIVMTETEKTHILSGLDKIRSAAAVALEYYLLKFWFSYQVAETCVYMESRKVNINFMNELEKGIYEDRRLASVLNLYRNYYKKKAADKKDPDDTIYDEIQLTYNIENSLHIVKRSVLAMLSFEKKPFLQNKTIQESDYLIRFIKSLTEQSGSLYSDVLKRNNIRQAKDGQVANHAELADRSTMIVDSIRDLGELMRSHFEHGDQIEQEMLAKNPKYKSKNSESWDALRAAIKPEVDLSTLIPQLNNVCKEVLKPVEETLKKPKLPKGTKDYNPLQMSIKNKVIEKIRNIYLKHGAVEIDTPVFELKETLTGKYGEEGNKLIYDLEDQGGELLSLRYDLTVPFARYMGLNALQKCKRFHIGKVYRRDQPNLNKGRFREFYQCDLDIAGKTQGMFADAEALMIMHEIYKSFDIDFKIKISHRLLLEAIIECSDCELGKFKTICSSIDKLDKEPWSAVEKELLTEKGLNQSQTDKLQTFVLNQGETKQLIDLIEEKKLFGDNPKAAKSLAELRELQSYLEIFGVNHDIIFDLSLARGLDYYTGLIYEAVLVGDSGLGSIGGGGRYDYLIGMFSTTDIPAVGLSIGIERLFIILEQKYQEKSRAVETEVFVASIGKGLIRHRAEILNECWRNGIKAETIYETDPKPDRQLKQALENKVPFIVWIGEDEIKKGELKIKCTYTKAEEVVKRTDLVNRLQELVIKYKDDAEKGLVVYPK